MDIKDMAEALTAIPLPAVAAAVALAGLLLVGILAWQSVMGDADKLARHRSGEPGTADLLNWGSVIDDGVILNKNGSLMAAWVYRGGDNESATKEDRNAVSAWINAATKQLGSGWMFHIDAIRRPCPNYIERGFSHFRDPVSAAIDEERREYFEGQGTLYEGCFVLVVTWFPAVVAQAKFVEMMFDDPEAGRQPRSRGDKLLDSFKREILNLESRLQNSFRMERLRSRPVELGGGETVRQDDFLRWLHYCMTGVNQPIHLSRNAHFVDDLLGGQDLVSGTIPIIGGNYIMVVAIDNFPAESMPGMLTQLGELPCEYRWSSRFIFLEPHDAAARINKFRRKWRQKVVGLKDQVFRTDNPVINLDAAAMVEDCDVALAEVNGQHAAFGYYSANVVLMGPDREALGNAALFVQKSAGVLGFPARIEDVNVMDAFLGTLPGHGVENVRRFLVNTRNLADLMPSSSIWTGQDMAPCEFYPPQSPALMHCVTTGHSPFRLNLHVRDLGHTIIFGPTGAGKSVLLATLAAQMLRYRGMTVFAFDKGMSMYTLCKAVGGRHYNIGGEDVVDEKGERHAPMAFCPLQYLDDRRDVAWAVEWLETLLKLNNVALTPDQRNELARCVENMRPREGKERHKTLLECYTSLQDKAMRAGLEHYTMKGPMGYLLDAFSDQLSLSGEGGLTVFEIEDLMGMGNVNALPVLLYLFRRVEKALHGQPAAIILDEAWLMLGHEVFREKIREWFKVLRKANCAIVLATQSLSDASRSGILDVIRESTATKIFLPNIHAKSDDALEVYRGMGLNRQQVEIIANAMPKRQYYYTSEMGNRLFELALGPLALALTAVSDKDSVAAVKRLEREHGDRWLGEWLKSRGIDRKVINGLTPGGEAA
jgi:type IV secretion system protein VirB4